MGKGLQKGTRWRLGAVLLAAAALVGGCGESGHTKGERTPALKPEAGERMREDGITIQVVGVGTAEAENPGAILGQVFGQAAKSVADEIRAGKGDRLPASVLEKDWPEVLDPALVYPGEILEEKGVRHAGEERFFTISPIDDYIFGRMDGNSYREGCPVAREDLRYLLILHYDLSGNIRVGELVCHKSVSEDMRRIFRELYEARYPIEKVALIDDYGGDDDWSSRDNNTSCFNYRTVAGSNKLSLHGLGVAIDVNPLYNPYITWNEQGEIRCAPRQGAAYMDRSVDFPCKIDEDDLCCRLFTQAGFTWGGAWEGRRDYMHLSRGYRPEG